MCNKTNSPLNCLLGKNVEEMIITGGKITKGVVAVGTEKIILRSEKAKLFFFLQKMSSMADCCSFWRQKQNKKPFGSL